MTSVTVRGEVVDETNVEWFLRRCAEALPGDMKPDSMMWGGDAAAALLVAAKGTSLHAAAVRALEAMLLAGSVDDARLAQSFAWTDVDAQVLARALQRDELPDDVRKGVRLTFGRVVSARPEQAYAPSLRALVGEPGWETLLGAIVVADHAWFVAHAATLLGDTANVAEERMWYAIAALRASEVRALRDELAGLRAALAPAAVDAALAYLDGELASSTFADGARRW